MMKNRLLFLGMVILVLSLSFVLVGCDDGETGGGGDPNIVTGIYPIKMPTKTYYVVGETLDLTGLTIRVYFTNEDQTEYRQEDFTTGFTTDPANGTALNETGTKSIKVTYGDKDASFNVTIGTIPKIPTATVSVTGVDMRADGTGVGGAINNWELTITLTLSAGKWIYDTAPNSYGFRGWFNPPNITVNGVSTTFPVWTDTSLFTIKSIEKESDDKVLVTKLRYNSSFNNLSSITVNLKADTSSIINYTNVITLTRGEPSNNTDNNPTVAGR